MCLIYKNNKQMKTINIESDKSYQSEYALSETEIIQGNAIQLFLFYKLKYTRLFYAKKNDDNM